MPVTQTWMAVQFFQLLSDGSTRDLPLKFLESVDRREVAEGSPLVVPGYGVVPGPLDIHRCQIK